MYTITVNEALKTVCSLQTVKFGSSEQLNVGGWNLSKPALCFSYHMVIVIWYWSYQYLLERERGGEGGRERGREGGREGGEKERERERERERESRREGVCK